MRAFLRRWRRLSNRDKAAFCALWVMIAAGSALMVAFLAPFSDLGAALVGGALYWGLR